MFKYKLNDFYNIADYDSNYVKHYLEAIGITKLESFLDTPPLEDELNPYLLENMDKGIKMLNKHLNNNNIIYLVVDSDPDGYTSGAIFYNYIKNISPQTQIKYSLHEEKEHGVELDKVPEDCNLIVIPDAGSNQKEELLKIVEQNKDILILDHHEVDVVVEHENIVIINNQISPQFNNKSLSGAGVTFKFVQAYDEAYQTGQYWKKYYDLATLGIISDVMYSGTLDNNYIIYHGLNDIHNKFLQALLTKQSYSISSVTNPTKIDIAFYITPVINGVVRIGTQEEKRNLFEAMANNDIEETIETSYRGTDRVENFYEYVARTSTNIKSRQDALITKTTDAIFEKIEKEGLDKHKIIVYKTSLTNKDEIQKTITGLVAMKIVAKYNKCALVLRPILKDGVQYYMGSGRGKKAEGFDSFREFLNNSELIEFASGHPMAFGTSIKEENIEQLIEYADKKLEDIDFGSEIVEVCGINPPYAGLMDFAQYPGLYGNGIPQPTFAFESVITRNDYKIMGARQDTIKFVINGIDFIKFHAKDIINELNEMDGYSKIQIAGRPQLNEFRGILNLQIVVDNINLEKYELI